MNWINKIIEFWNRPKEILKPGLCECGHSRCVHKKGKGRCKGEFAPDNDTPFWTDCSCVVYIKDDDDDGYDGYQPTPSPAELEKLYELR